LSISKTIEIPICHYLVWGERNKKDNLNECKIEITLKKEVNSIIEELCSEKKITKEDLIWDGIKIVINRDHFSKFEKKEQ